MAHQSPHTYRLHVPITPQWKVHAVGKYIYEHRKNQRSAVASCDSDPAFVSSAIATNVSAENIAASCTVIALLYRVIMAYIL